MQGKISIKLGKQFQTRSTGHQQFKIMMFTFVNRQICPAQTLLGELSRADVMFRKNRRSGENFSVEERRRAGYTQVVEHKNSNVPLPTSPPPTSLSFILCSLHNLPILRKSKVRLRRRQGASTGHSIQGAACPVVQCMLLYPWTAGDSCRLRFTELSQGADHTNGPCPTDM